MSGTMQPELLQIMRILKREASLDVGGVVNLACKHLPGLCELQEVLLRLTVNQKEH